MTILNERTYLDTNVFIFGLRLVRPASRELLTYLDRIHLVIPERVLRELAANLTPDELREVTVQRSLPHSVLLGRA